MKIRTKLKKNFLLVGSILLIATFFACNKAENAHEHSEGGEHEHAEGHKAEGHAMKAQYKMVETGDLKASFEFSTMGDHMESMKKMGMNMKMDHGKMGDHHIMLTLLNKSDGQMNSEVKEVTFTITTPDGKSTTKKAHLMHKEQMHHFGIDFHAAGKGTYKFKAEFQHKGKKHSPEVSFEM